MSSRNIPFYFTDVFGNEKYSGNQLATFTDCDFLTTEEMQKIAREINFSETTFILRNTLVNGGYDVRIFTPGAEIDFAGHPTLGTAYLIHKHIDKGNSNTIRLNLKVGQIPVDVSGDILWMDQVQPQFNEKMDINRIAKMLTLEPGDIMDSFPVQEVSTGLPSVIIPLKDMKALKSCRINAGIYQQFISDIGPKPVLVFSPEGYDYQQKIAVRVFVDCFGIPEDPATGSANGCLAAYLVKYQFFGENEIDLVAGQGYEIDRPSQLYLRSELTDKYYIKVGGKVNEVAKGNWH